MRGGRRMALWRNREEIRSAEAARKATLKRARCTGVVHHTPVETGCKEEPAKARQIKGGDDELNDRVLGTFGMGW